MATQLISRLRYSGKCPPSLLPSLDTVSNNDEFLCKVVTLVENGEGVVLRNDAALSGEFELVIKMATDYFLEQESVDSDQKAKVLAQRRCIVLAVVGSTPSGNKLLKTILSNGYLFSVKSWLEDILSKKIGGVDLLLHLLDSIAWLPISKDMVTSSRLGKLIGSIEKHTICLGSANERTIIERVTVVKERWSASVKQPKPDGETLPQANLKRSLTNDDDNVEAKRARSNEQRNMLSNLVKKVATNMNDATTMKRQTDKGETDSRAELQTKVAPSALSGLKKNVDDSSSSSSGVDSKKSKHIYWADSTGKALTVARVLDPMDDFDKESFNQNDHNEIQPSGEISWSDRKKRDRLHEKALLQQARKSKLIDTEDSFNGIAMMYSRWRQPTPLPPHPENPPIQVVSKELAIQVRRMSLVLPNNYLSDEQVPSNPFPLTDSERSQEVLAERSIVPLIIPFFVPQQESPPLTSFPVPAAVPVVSAFPQSLASIEMVQALGLPTFLVGQNIAALQTLAASPGLLNTYIDVNGMYDQMRLLSLVATLTQNISSNNIIAHQPIVQTQPVKPFVAAVPFSTGQASLMQSKNGYRGDQNILECNLHLSGYGPGTTPDTIMALFSPYVKVEEVVPKNGFMFVNTSDPDGAKRAKEALSGVIVGGAPLRINLALRRAKIPSYQAQDASSASLVTQPTSRSNVVSLPINAYGQIDYDSVTDDRGNPATKNLFVAGFGPGTTENELLTLFGQYAVVTTVILKGAFAFVNTTEKNAAIHAREALTGTAVHGGLLRINFAKESGRLGTSFDVGYNLGKSANAAAEKYSYYGRT